MSSPPSSSSSSSCDSPQPKTPSRHLAKTPSHAPTPEQLQRFEERADSASKTRDLVASLGMHTGDTRGLGWTSERKEEIAKTLKDASETIREQSAIIRDITLAQSRKDEVPLSGAEKALVAKALGSLFLVEHEGVSALSQQLSALLLVTEDPVSRASSRLNDVLSGLDPGFEAVKKEED